VLRPTKGIKDNATTPSSIDFSNGEKGVPKSIQKEETKQAHNRMQITRKGEANPVGPQCPRGQDRPVADLKKQNREGNGEEENAYLKNPVTPRQLMTRLGP